MPPTNVRKAAAMLADLEITKGEVEKHFRVSWVTLKAFLGARGGWPT